MSDLTPSALANAVMGKLYDVLTSGDATVPKSADNFFSWMTPGIPMDPADFEFLTQGLTGVVKPQDVANLVVPGSPTAGSSGPSSSSDSGTPSSGQVLTIDEINQLRATDTGRMFMQAEMLAQLVDVVPEVSMLTNNQFAQFNVSNNEGTLSDRYALILKMSQVMSQELDAATQAKIAKFRGLLQATITNTDLITGVQTQSVVSSPLVQAYNTKMAAYDAAALQYNAARIAALAGNDPTAVETWAIDANILRNQVKAAMDDWITNGYKTDYEEIAAYIDQVQQRDLKLLKQEYEDDLAKATLTGLSSGSNFYYTALIPGNFAQSTGWSHYEFDSGDYSSYTNSTFNQSGWSAQAGGGFFGLFASGGGSGSSTSQSYNGSFASDHFTLKFEMAQIPIVRPWFKEVFVTSKSWRFDPTSPDVKGEMVSDAGSPPKGLLPAYPTTPIFIRNLVLRIDQSSSAASFINQASSSSQSGGGFVSLGPIFLGGRASHWSKSGYTQRAYSGSGAMRACQCPACSLLALSAISSQRAPIPIQALRVGSSRATRRTHVLSRRCQYGTSPPAIMIARRPLVRSLPGPIASPSRWR
jgi:hypothetical protein